MREILFRGKRVDNGEWVEGDYYHEQVGGYLTAAFIKEPLTSGVWENHRVDPSTIGQYTGLCDSTRWDQLTKREREEFLRQGNLPTDWKGKKVFEGDIVKFHMFRDEPDWIGVVKYDISMFIVTGDHYTGRSGFETQLCSLNKSRFRLSVIGNITDNPELLKGANDAEIR